jgi:hypothetical protein
MELIAVLVIVYGSIIWVLLKLLNMFRAKDAGCSCDGCDKEICGFKNEKRDQPDTL